MNGITFSNCSIGLEVKFNSYNVSFSSFDYNNIGINTVLARGAIVSSLFSNNNQGIIIWGSDVSIHSSSFSSNNNGIIVNPPRDTNLIITSSSFNNNIGMGSDASAINSYGNGYLNQNLFISNSTFNQNGGSFIIHAQFPKSITLSSSSFSNNSNDDGLGTIVSVEDGPFISSFNSFNNNKMNCTVLNRVNNAMINNDQYYNNEQATLNIYYSSFINIDGSIFESNAHGIISEGSIITINNVHFSNNNALFDGGGFLNKRSTTGNATGIHPSFSFF